MKQFLLISIHPETLENTLKKNLPRLSQLKSKGVIFTDLWEKLFPASGDPPNVDKFDITLLHLLIREFSNLPTPAKGWHKLPDETDDSMQANITRIKCFRNELSHQSSTAISESEFEEKWTEISSSLEEILEFIHRQKIKKKLIALKVIQSMILWVRNVRITSKNGENYSNKKVNSFTSLAAVYPIKCQKDLYMVVLRR